MGPRAGWGICDANITQIQEIWVLISILIHGCVGLFTCSRNSGHRGPKLAMVLPPWNSIRSYLCSLGLTFLIWNGVLDWIWTE